MGSAALPWPPGRSSRRRSFVVKIASNPPGKTVEWSYTNRCIKNNELHSFPGPGDHTILTDKTKIKETMQDARLRP